MSGYQPRKGDEALVTMRARITLGHGLDRPWWVVGGSEAEQPLLTLPTDHAAIVRVEPAPVVLPTGFGARIRATVTCACGDEESGVPVRDVLLVDTGEGNWRARQHLPCGCSNFIPQQASGDDAFADVVVLDQGEPS